MFIEELITRSLILVFGYLYPAFKCFKTLEKNKVALQELKFWCQYWLIVTVLSILEIFLDVFVSWIPFYRGIKLITYIYLWHPGTKGSTYIYDTLVKPYVSKYEPNIDRTIEEVKERVWNLALDYWYKSAHMSSKKVLECVQMLMTQCMNAALSRPKDGELQKSKEAASPTPPSTPVLKRNGSEKKPPLGSSPSGKDNQIPKSNSFKVKLHSQAKFIHTEDVAAPDSSGEEKPESNHDFAKVRLRRVNGKE